jgi:hypothetical protein
LRIGAADIKAVMPVSLRDKVCAPLWSRGAKMMLDSFARFAALRLERRCEPWSFMATNRWSVRKGVFQRQDFLQSNMPEGERIAIGKCL